MHKDFTKLDLTKLKEGDKITIVKMSEFGYPLTIHMKLNRIFLKDWAQYKNCIQIQGKLPRKRKLTAYLMKPHEDFVVYKGFIELKSAETSFIDELGTRITNMGVCFDNDLLFKINDNNLEKIYNSYNI